MAPEGNITIIVINVFSKDAKGDVHKSESDGKVYFAGAFQD